MLFGLVASWPRVQAGIMVRGSNYLDEIFGEVKLKQILIPSRNCLVLYNFICGMDPLGFIRK